jgi:hypothetical protein
VKTFYATFLSITSLFTGQTSLAQEKADSILHSNGGSISFVAEQTSPPELAYRLTGEASKNKPEVLFPVIATALDSDIKEKNIGDSVNNGAPQDQSYKSPHAISLSTTKSSKWLLSSNDSLYKVGVQDGRFYYTDYHEAGTVTLLTSILFTPVVGLVPAIFCSKAKPKAKTKDER